MLTISEYKDAVNEELARQYEIGRHTALSVDPIFNQLIDEMENFIVRGGKRLRPYLLYLAYTGAGGKNTEAILPIAAGLEMLHNFLLIHDDILDRDVMRYGGPNIQGVYNTKLAAHFELDRSLQSAADIALIAGDVAHILSSQAILNSQIAAPHKVATLQLIHETTLKVAGGELVDIMLPLDLPDIIVTTERVTRLYRNKTAVYTFEMPMRLGMILANKENGNKDTLFEFAESLGVAYQISDDLLGVFGEEADTGKPTDSDIREGKRTLLYYYAEQLLSSPDLALFRSVYGNSHTTSAHISQLRQLLNTTGVKSKVELVRDEYFTKAESLLPKLGFSKQVTTELSNLVALIQKRTK